MFKTIAIIALLWTSVTSLYIEKKVNCPENIKNQFSITPNNTSETLTCFEINGQLKACKHGTFESEDCFSVDINTKAHDKQLRVKRQVEFQSYSKNKRRIPNRQDAVGRSVNLGNLYYGDKDEIVTTENFWNEATLEAKATTKYSNESHGEAKISQNYQDSLSNINVKGSLQLSFLSGLVKVEGTAKYLENKRTNSKSIGINYQFERIYKSVELNQELRRGIDFSDHCKKVGKPGGPTHVVSGVKKGIRAAFSFTYKTDTENYDKSVGGSLRVLVDSIPSFKIDAQANVDISDETKNISKNLKCSFRSDIKLDVIPVTFEDAVRAYKSLYERAYTLTDSDTVLYFELDPIDRYCDKAASVLNDLSDDTMNKMTTALTELEEIELTASSLSQTEAATSYYKIFGKPIDDFIRELRTYTSGWKERLYDNLPLMRAGDKNAEKELVQSLIDYYNSPFDFRRANEFLKNRRTEMDAAGITLVRNKDLDIAIDDGSSAVIHCKWNHRYKVRYELNILPKGNIVEAYMNAVNDPAMEWSEKEQWFHDQISIGQASAVFRDFRDYRILHSERNDVCFYVELKHIGEEYKNAKIVVSNEDGKPIRDDFRILEVNSPETFKVADTFIHFNVGLMGDSFTNTIQVTTKKLLGDGRTQSFPISSDGNTSIKLNNLTPNTPYTVSFNAASELGKSSPSSKEFIITTNSYTKPQNLRIVERNDSWISMRWEKPAFIAPNTSIIAYDVSIASYFNSPTQDIELISNVKKERYEAKTDQNAFDMTVTGLQHATKYIVEVVPISNHTSTPESHIERLETKAVVRSSTLPKPPQAPNVINTTHHRVELRWDPPERIVEGSTVTSYLVRYNRIDPKCDEPLTTGNEKIAYSNNNQIILEDMAAGGTYRIEVKVETTDGCSAYSASKFASIPMKKTELDQIRDSLNIPDIEKRLEEMNEIATRTTALENKPRFAAEIRSDQYLPKGDITGFTELVDVGNNFDPQTGRLTIKDEMDAGMYTLIVNAFKGRDSGDSGENRGGIRVYKNHEKVQDIYESDAVNHFMMNGVFTLHLQKRDEVKLYDHYDESIYVDGSYYPFTFIGYKI